MGIMDYLALPSELPLTHKESNFIQQIGADILIKDGTVPSNEDILKEIIYRAMLVKGVDVPEH